MNKEGAIILVEDDEDDQSLFSIIFSELGVKNEIIIFANGLEAYNYLTKSIPEPFLIISDINMPIMNGIELKKNLEINSNSNLLAVPFIFISTANPMDTEIIKTKKLGQGYFKKPNSLEDYRKTIKDLLEFWTAAMEPQF